VVAGLRPIYLQIPGEMTIDPLYELGAWRAIISDVVGFQGVIYPSGDQLEYQHYLEAEKATQYCEQLFTQINANSIETLVP